ncbi:MAG TPA: Gfo/Idh/MocA family oxidoreductase [Candidatus Limnocylindrales bacterium]|nr:Gfo/Idh/MocA family oxidoreductase [Candidatus Limnocylindrales bacterium]
MSDLGVLVVGAGRAGMVHARNFAAGLPGCRLVGVCDPATEVAERAAGELGCRAFADPLAAVTDDGVDAVVIASPTFSHAELAVAALSAGKHVLSEKPLAASLDDGRRIEAAAGRSDAAFMMAFMRRFDRGFQRARELVEQGAVGEPLYIRSTTRGPGLPPPWAWDVERSGGLIAEVNSHDIDTVRWLTGQEFVQLRAVGRAAKRPDIAATHEGFVDVLAVQASLDGGSLAHVDGACPADYGYDARVELYGSEGVLFVGDATEGPIVVTRQQARRDPVSGWARLFADAYREEDRQFVAACRGDAPALPGIEDGVRALEVVIAVNRSLRENRDVRLSDVR